MTRSRSDAGVTPRVFDLGEASLIFFGAPARGLRRDLEVALDDSVRLFGAHLLGARLRLRFLLVTQSPRVLVEQAVVVEERAAHAVELVDDLRVFVVHAFDLDRELGARFVGRREPRLRGALFLGGAQPFDLAAQPGRGDFGPGAGRSLLLEQFALLEHDAPRLFGGAEVAAGQSLDFGQPLLGPAEAGRRGRVDRDRLDA